MKAATYEEAFGRLEDLTVRISYLEDQMAELLERMLAQESWWQVFKVLNQRETVVRAQHVLLDEWNEALNDLVGFLEPGDHAWAYRHFHPSIS